MNETQGDETRAGETSDGRVLAILERMERRLAHLEEQQAAMARLVGEAPGLAAAAADTLDGTVARLADRGVDVDERLRSTLTLLERLTDPATLASLEQGLALAAAVPGLTASAVDTLDGIVARLAANGVNVDERAHVLAHVAERLTAPEALAALSQVLANVGALSSVLDSGIFEESAVAVVGSAARALADIRTDGVRPIGAWGALRALSDPDVQRSLGVAVEFGRRFGCAIEEQRNGTDQGAV